MFPFKAPKAPEPTPGAPPGVLKKGPKRPPNHPCFPRLKALMFHVKHQNTRGARARRARPVTEA